jgi:UDP-3-O-[3-hydroxymyristoyl] N-acetylglucosamine deacetylase/3-hydroxyacyl-[acyl-carrier-protein] dehydratase
LSLQRTIKTPVTVEGRGLFSGRPCRLRFAAAPAGSGIVFVRTDLASPVEIPAVLANLSRRPRRSALTNGTAAVETVEHVLAAVSGVGIDNLRVEVDAEEMPSPDSSSLPFAKALREAGAVEQDAPRRVLAIDEPVTVSDGDAMIAALPGRGDCLDILYELDYGSAPGIERQVAAFRLGKDDFTAHIAPARTFLTEREAREFQAQGMGKHLTHEDLLVIGPSGPVGTRLRFSDEPVRHKVADLIGDLALLGRSLRGRIVAYKSGHELNHALVRRLLEEGPARKPPGPADDEPVMDIRNIMRLVPHRYPFLMVDRILKIEGDLAVGLKNVSINEPYFQGHYPNQPIMPGVLILEALAQLSGILLSRRLEHTGKVAVLLSMDRVKMRRPVRPGDQLTLQAEAVHVRSRTGHCRCRATVGTDVAAEAEIKFMLVDSEPV